jgi:hypothetical protein
VRHDDFFTEVRFLQTYSPLRWSQRPGLFQSFPSLKRSLGLGRGFDLFGVSCIECYSSCKVWEVGKLGCHEWRVVGGIYNPNHQKWPLGGYLSHGAPDTVPCASHISRPLGSDRWSSDWWGLWAVWWCTGQVL